MTGTVTTAAPGDALPPQTGTAPIFTFTPTPCPTCGRCPTCGHPAPVSPPPPWQPPPWSGPWWGIVPPHDTTWGGPVYLTAMGTGRTYPGFGSKP